MSRKKEKAPVTGYDYSTREAREVTVNDLPWVPANMPDPWIMVESQIDPNVPEPEGAAE